MRILIVRDVPGELNAKKMTYNIQEVGLATALRKKGHTCDILWCSNDHKYREEEIVSEGHTIKLYVVRSLDFLKNAWIKDADHIFEQYDVLQVCEYNQMYTRHLAKKYPKKFVCYHGPYYCEFNKNYNRMAKIFDMFFVDRYRKLGSHFITKSGLAADYLKAKGIKNVTPIGVGLSASFLGGENVEMLPELEVIRDTKCLKLLYIGVLEPRRNSLFMLDVIAKVKAMGVEFKQIVIGRFKDDIYKQEFWTRAETLGVKNNVIYIQRVEQKYLTHVYANTDIFLLPTIYDIYGMVLLEAMYFSMPTLTTINGGSNMMIESGKNGVVFKDFNASEWAECIENLSHDLNKAKMMGQLAHEKIVNEYTWDKLADKFIEAYKKRINS